MALLDFDVHHGNGTQACIGNTVPSLASYKFHTPVSKGSQTFPQYKPWLDFDDPDNIFFARSILLFFIASYCHGTISLAALRGENLCSSLISRLLATSALYCFVAGF